MMYEIVLSDEAKADFVRHKTSGQKKLLSKIGTFVEELKEHPPQAQDRWKP